MKHTAKTEKTPTTKPVPVLPGVEQSLKNSELRYRRLFESIQDGILILDAGTGSISDVNPYLINMLGYSQSNARVSTLMRNFAASPYLENPELVEIKAATVANKRVSDFNMNVSLKRLQTEEAGKAGKAAPKAPAPKS